MTSRIHINKDASVHGTLRTPGMILKVCMDPAKNNASELKRRLEVLDDAGTFMFPFVHKNRETILKLERDEENGHYDLTFTTKLTVSDDMVQKIKELLEGMAVKTCTTPSTEKETLHDVSSRSNLLDS